MRRLHGAPILPALDFVVGPFVVDAFGRLELDGAWLPGIDPNRTYFFQMVIEDRSRTKVTPFPTPS